jgi:hypothetical protein
MSPFLSLVKLVVGWGTYRNGVTGLCNLKGETAGVRPTLFIFAPLPAPAALQRRSNGSMTAGVIMKKIT